jgi:hypothetical protein
MGRPLNSSRPFEEVSAAPSSDTAVSERRIEELERKIGQQQLDLDFFRAAPRLRRGKLCGMSGNNA